MHPRRRFLHQTGILTAGLMTDSCDLFNKTSKKPGIQLYTLRNDIGKDVKGVMEKVATAGFKEVETFGLSADERYFGLTVKEFSGLLKNNGLTSPSGHYTPAKMLFENGNGDDVKKLCDVGNLLGHKYIIIPYLNDSQRKNLDQYKILAEKFNKAGEICKKNNQQLAYHNHDFEFIEMDGRSGYDVFLEDTDKDLLKMELDLYWVFRAGLDPVELFKKQPGRFPLWHIKDMDKGDNKLNTEIGKGTIDFKRLMANAKLAGAKHFYLEQENNYLPDYYSSIQTSSDYMRKNLMK